MATNDFSRFEVRRPSSDVALLDAVGDGHPPLISLLVEGIAAEHTGAELMVRRFLTDSWSIDVRLGLTHGMSIIVLAKTNTDPVAALVLLSPNAKLASALTIASGLSFALVCLVGMIYCFLVARTSGKVAILAGVASGAAVALPLFGIAWVVDNVLNSLGPRAVARLRGALNARVSAAFPPAT